MGNEKPPVRKTRSKPSTSEWSMNYKMKLKISWIVVKIIKTQDKINDLQSEICEMKYKSRKLNSPVQCTSEVTSRINYVIRVKPIKDKIPDNIASEFKQNINS